MLPHVTKPVWEWTAEERYAVVTNNLEWIQRCLDHNEEEDKNQKLLQFLKEKENGTNRFSIKFG